MNEVTILSDKEQKADYEFVCKGCGIVLKFGSNFVADLDEFFCPVCGESSEMWKIGEEE